MGAGDRGLSPAATEVQTTSSCSGVVGRPPPPQTERTRQQGGRGAVQSCHPSSHSPRRATPRPGLWKITDIKSCHHVRKSSRPHRVCGPEITQRVSWVGDLSASSQSSSRHSHFLAAWRRVIVIAIFFQVCHIFLAPIKLRFPSACQTTRPTAPTSRASVNSSTSTTRTCKPTR